jgi:hypothetical protein
MWDLNEHVGWWHGYERLVELFFLIFPRQRVREIILQALP